MDKTETSTSLRFLWCQCTIMLLHVVFFDTGTWPMLASVGFKTAGTESVAISNPMKAAVTKLCPISQN
jgi:hypothetical protein